MLARHLPIVLLSIAGILGAEPKRDRYGDPLPEGAVARMGSVRLRSEFPVLAAAFAPDGKTLATAGDGPSICFWDPATGKEVRRIAVKSPRQVWCLRFRADGKTLILAGGDTAVYVVNAATGAEQRKLDAPGRGSVLALDVSGDGKTAVAMCSPGDIIVWDLHSGKRLRTFLGLKRGPDWHGEWLALTPDGKQLVLPQADGSPHLMDVASGKEVFAFEIPPPWPANTPNEFLRVAISPDGRYLACGGDHHSPTLHDLKTGKRVREFAPSLPNATGLTFAPNSRFLAVSLYRDIRIFSVLSGKEVRKFATPLGSTVRPLVFSKDGRTLSSVGSGHLLGLWDVVAGRQLHPPVGHLAPVHALVFFPDGKRLASGAAFGEDLAVWDIAASRDLAHYRGANAFASTLGVAADGKTLQFLADDHVIHRWDPSAGHEERQQAHLPPAATPIALSPDGRSVAGTCGYARQVHLQDLNKDKAARELTLPANVWCSELLFSPDGRHLLSESSDGTLRLWERATGKQMWKLNLDRPDRGAQRAFASDGRSLAAAGDKVRLIEASSGGERLGLRPTSPASSVACSPDGRFLAYGQLDGGIVVRGTATGKQLAYWQGRQGTIRSLAFNRSSCQLASGGENGTVLVWKLPDGENLPTTLKRAEADALWQALRDTPAHANRALAGLAAAPAQAVPLIKDRCPSAWKKPDAKRLARLIADLDADAFKVRERATHELANASLDAAGALRQALANNPSAEAKRRIEGLLHRLSKDGSPERLRALRAIEVLERIGSPQAKDVLRELAGKPLPAELREEVQASLRRIGAKP